MNRNITVYAIWNLIPEIATPEISLKANNNKITINWDKQVLAEKYEISYSTNNKKWTKKTVTSNSYVFKNLTYNKKYYYKVRAYDGTKWSKYSNVLTKKVVPNKVNNLMIKGANTNKIKLEWDKVGATGYEVYRSTDNKKWTKVSTITKNTTVFFDDTKLKANKTYYYKVRAYKTASGKKVYGSYSNVVETKTAPLKPNFNVKLESLNEMRLIVEFSKGASLYVVQKSTDGKTYTLLENLYKPENIIVSELELGKTYYYRVRACNSQNRCSDWITKSLKLTTKTPSISLKTSSKKVTITVGNVIGADGYEIYRSTSKNGKYKLVKTLIDIDGIYIYNDKTTKGYYYYYKVRSYKIVNGNKVYSAYSGIKSIKSK
jgi:fibronectin type 3 domain-containing protein